MRVRAIHLIWTSTRGTQMLLITSSYTAMSIMYYDLDISEYAQDDMKVSWRFALGYSNGMFSFVAYREY